MSPSAASPNEVLSAPSSEPVSNAVRRYRLIALVTTAGIALLVVAGGIVRLTGSGLGCDDWPRCNDRRFVDVSSGHTAIEQVNRLLSGAIGVPTLLLVVAALVVRRRRPDLLWPAVGVLLSILGNGVVGGIAVRGELHPALVQSHFLLAMISIAFGVVAIHRSSNPRRSPDSVGPESRIRDERVDGIVRLGVWTMAALTALALATGTVVTGTGPHAGDQDVRRFGFDISEVAKMHSGTVILALVAALGLAVRLRGDVVASERLSSLLSAWIFIGLLQGAVGYTQYFNGVPEVLVALHIALATMLWTLTVWFVLRALSPVVSKQLPRITQGVVVNA